MWFLSFVPDSILLMAIYAVIAAGVGLYALGMFLGFFPSLILYKEPIRILATLLIIAGVYFYGSYDTEMKWRARVSEVQAKVEEYKKESDNANTKLAAKSKEKQKVRVEYYAQVKERIVEKTVQIDAKCELDPEVAKLHNQAASNPAGKVTVGEVK
jgi:hypothetical protein